MKVEDGAFHHFALTVTDLERSKRFYTRALGFASVLDVPGLSLVSGYGVLFGLRTHDGGPPGRFDPSRTGLDHLAIAVQAGALESLKRDLDAAGVPNNGIQDDELTKARYVCFYDPDGIPWELYAMPAQSSAG